MSAADSMIRPNFFIIGAPKGGTTALANYLSDHPNVFFSAPKEVFYWADDFPKSREVYRIRDLKSYLELFNNAIPEQHQAIGEGSTTYFQSENAIANILAFNPAAKFIVMLRNPVDVAHGMHGELVRHFYETEKDFEKAWGLQADRAAGRLIPTPDFMEHQLQYQAVASFAPQLRRMFSLVPEPQRHVIIFDDFVRDTRACYQQTLKFLQIPDDGRTEFPKVNAASKYRLPLIGKLYQAPPAWLSAPMRVFRKWYGKQGGAFRNLVHGLTQRPAPREALSPEFREHLKSVFRDDVTEISDLLGRDLSSWTRESGSVHSIA